MDFVKSRGMACSVYGSQYLLEGLFASGEEQYALYLMRATHDRSWWNMIASGSTITMEAWDLKYKTNLDWNHAWGAAPANIIPRYLWGIRPAKPGFSEVVIQPRLANLRESTITCPTIRGPISCEYKYLSDMDMRYSVDLPANMVGEFFLGDLGEAVITLNGQVQSPGYSTLRLQPGKSSIEIRINSF